MAIAARVQFIIALCSPCSFCDGAPPIEGIDFGAALSYNVGHHTSRIGYYMGSIRQGSTYPADRDALTFAERVSPARTFTATPRIPAESNFSLRR